MFFKDFEKNMVIFWILGTTFIIGYYICILVVSVPPLPQWSHVLYAFLSGFSLRAYLTKDLQTT